MKKPRRAKTPRDWWPELKLDEAAEIARLDDALAEMHKAMTIMRRTRNKIVNRASARAGRVANE